MKQILSFLLVVLSFGLGSAQVTVTNCTAMDAAQALINNPSIQIVSATYIGATQFPNDTPVQLGLFSGTAGYIGMTDGVILTTGGIEVAECPNYISSCNVQYWRDENPVSGSHYDADLNQITPGSQHSTTVLEIVFIPSIKDLNFKFVFASEEYKEFVIGNYNDAFGFFLSSSVMSGPYSNNGVNLALVPGTSLPINVDNINDVANSAYFVDNNCRALAPDFYAPCPFPSFSYDGYTKVLTASYSGLVCGETYKLKMVLSNIADDDVASAVFIGGKSLGNFDAGSPVATPNPICEGQQVNFSCTGNPSYTYQWYSEATGLLVGTGQSIVLNPTLAALPYYVIITDPNGCTDGVKKYVDLSIYNSINSNPFTQGIDNTGEHEYYVYAGESFDFDIFSYDADNENVSASLAWIGTPPPNTSHTFNPSYTPLNKDHKSVHLSGTIGLPGEYPFVLTLTDDNPCGPTTTQKTFTIIVLCGDCPMDVLYEKRGGGNPVLPALTEAAYKIRAGNSVDPAQTDGPVIVNSGQNVVFKAGEFVLLEPGFTAVSGSTFLAQIAPSNCEGSCGSENCCQGKSKGFRYDPIPNILTPNGDNNNDLWFVSDSQFPYCAYNAMGFDLVIYNRYGTVVHSLSSSANYCCSLQSIISNGEHPDIYWDGTALQSGIIVSTGVYDFVLKFFGCNGTEKEVAGTITVSY